MKKYLMIILLLLISAALVSCSLSGNRAKMTFYHGQKIPDQFIRVLNYTAEEIEFEIRVDFKQTHLYHIVLDGENPIAEGWLPTAKTESAFYTLKMKAKKGCQFQVGKKYRLCIGDRSPEEVFVHSSNYRCIADYEFVLQ
jgi:hypothetical protein